MAAILFCRMVCNHADWADCDCDLDTDDEGVLTAFQMLDRKCDTKECQELPRYKLPESWYVCEKHKLENAAKLERYGVPLYQTERPPKRKVSVSILE